MERDFLAEYVLELWKKRFIIIISAAGLGILTFLLCKFVAPQIYQAKALVYVREKPNYTNAERQQVSPLSIEKIIKNPALINEVREEYCSKTKKTPPMLELFIKEFEAKTTLVEDTTIRKKASPVIDISVTADTRENAKLLMEIWTKKFIKKYGDLVAQDAAYTANYYKERLDAIQSELDIKVTEYSKVKWQLPAKIKMLSDAEDIIAPGRMFYPIREKESSILGPYNYQDINVQLQEPSAFMQPQANSKQGLSEKLKNLEKDLIVEESLKGDTKKTKAEIDAVKIVISKTEEEVKTLQGEVAKLEKLFESLGREIKVLKQQHELTSSLYSQTDLEAKAITSSQKNEFEGSDAYILAPATMPDKRVFPRMTLFSLIGVIIGVLLSVIAIITRKYLNDAEKNLAV